VDEHVDVGEVQAGIAEDEAHAFQHTLLGPLRGGEHLAGDPLRAAIEHDVGEGAADIGGESDVETL
jgi:hypothetical protein